VRNLKSDIDEIGKALCKVLAEIAEREKKKAVEIDDYGQALVAALFEGFFKEAMHSFI